MCYRNETPFSAKWTPKFWSFPRLSSSAMVHITNCSAHTWGHPIASLDSDIDVANSTQLRTNSKS